MMLFKINPEWILNFRSEMLTSWFKIFPFLLVIIFTLQLLRLPTG
ncbi:hypothetical protein REIP_0963 [Rickettsia endosymbiont of Ixodes pacificus]|nr:hypothetical protein REIS_0321 [Rickettsia endosymbiont of Ixodes scapularis]KJW02945.1 hypothetical protein REIP_0963 [Rickettsia endosymbiont of Ixodes pacificus]